MLKIIGFGFRRELSRYRKALMIYRSIVIESGATETHDSYYVCCRTVAARRGID